MDFQSFVLRLKDSGLKVSHNLNKLTKAEENVVVRCLTGDNLDDIANRLNISIKTIKFHLSSIYKKLNVKSRSEMISSLFVQFIKSEYAVEETKHFTRVNGLPIGNQELYDFVKE